MTRRAWVLAVLQVGAVPAADSPHYADHDDLLYYLNPDGEQQAVRSPQDWNKRRRHIVAGMETVMGPLPRGPKPSLEMHLLAESRHDGYVHRRITYQAKEGDAIPAYLLIPSQPGLRPAVLALHPTGELGKGIPAGLSDRPNRQYGEELARRGYVVLMPDYPYMGDEQRDPYELGYVSGTMKGVYNHVRGVDLLESMAEVDKDRIGAIGHSLGGHNALFLAVFEPRIRAVVTSCGFNSFAKYKGGDLTGWSSNKYMPRIASRHAKSPARMPFDFTEILGAIAPRPVFISAPTGDENFEVSGVKDCVLAARPIYERVFDAGDRLVATHPACGHDFPMEVRARAYHFLDRWL